MSDGVRRIRVLDGYKSEMDSCKECLYTVLLYSTIHTYQRQYLRIKTRWERRGISLF